MRPRATPTVWSMQRMESVTGNRCHAQTSGCGMPNGARSFTDRMSPPGDAQVLVALDSRPTLRGAFSLPAQACPDDDDNMTDRLSPSPSTGATGFTVRDLIRPLCYVTLISFVLLAVAPTVSRPAREWVLVRSSTAVGARHLEYAPPDDEERDLFMRDRSDVEVVVPWDMSGEELLNLYGLRTHPNAEATVAAEAGGLGGLLLEGTSFSIELN